MGNDMAHGTWHIMAHGTTVWCLVQSAQPTRDSLRTWLRRTWLSCSMSGRCTNVLPHKSPRCRYIFHTWSIWEFSDHFWLPWRITQTLLVFFDHQKKAHLHECDMDSPGDLLATIQTKIRQSRAHASIPSGGS